MSVEVSKAAANFRKQLPKGHEKNDYPQWMRHPSTPTAERRLSWSPQRKS